MRRLFSKLFADDWRKLAQASEGFRDSLDAAKQAASQKNIAWYPYDSLANFSHIDALLTPRSEGPALASLSSLIGKDAVLDIGCADGATSFFLAALGHEVDAVDLPRTNYNGMKGIYALNEVLDRPVHIHAVDLDSQFALPRARYGVAFFLGILYHLKNPFFVLEELSRHTRYCFLSTRVTKLDGTRTVDIEKIPAAYLVGPEETNNDDTNFWIFTRAGLLRLLNRTGWEVVRYMHVGNTVDSDPATPKGDERAFCFLRSRNCTD